MRAGSAQIIDQGSKTLIQQSSQRAIIDWRGFGINANEQVQFAQPSAGAATLNRVTGSQVSMILGRMDANGQVLLINPNGIIFGKGAQINVGSLIASTANLSNENFMQGRLIFDQPGKPGAGIVNSGSITAAEGGLVALVAPHVRNDGLIQARLGKVTLGAADTFTIDLYGDGLINLALTDASLAQLKDAQGQPVKSLISQAGTIDVGSGKAVLVTAEAAKGMLDSLINMSGIIFADSAVQEGGRILLLARGGNVDVSGELSAKGTAGGQIEVLGDQVHLASTAKLDADGGDGGGKLHVGGAFQGSGGYLPFAEYTDRCRGDTAGQRAERRQWRRGGRLVGRPHHLCRLHSCTWRRRSRRRRPRRGLRQADAGFQRPGRRRQARSTAHRFGSLLRAYQLVGYEPDRDFEYLETNRRLREMYPRVVEDVVARWRKRAGQSFGTTRRTCSR